MRFREVLMWVWSDELVGRFPGIRPNDGAPLPLLAISVNDEADLESLARDVVREYESRSERAVATGDGSTGTER